MNAIKKILVISFSVLCLWACGKDSAIEVPKVKDPITISFPKPQTAVSKVSLSSQQQMLVSRGNDFALKCLKSIYDKEGSNALISPLSLQYALSLTANGTSGNTAEEILSVLWQENDIEAINALCSQMLNQFPSLDDSVKVTLANAVLVRDNLRVQDSFKNISETVYYSPVEYVSADAGQKAYDRINEWAYRMTDGNIYPLYEQAGQSPDFVAVILNSLHFKAKWREFDSKPMFQGDFTGNSHPFHCEDGSTRTMDYMSSSNKFRYGRIAGADIVELPYADGKFAMYVAVPDRDRADGLNDLISTLSLDSLSRAQSLMSADAIVNLELPKFEIRGNYELSDMLQQMGITLAFDRERAEFDKMIQTPTIGNLSITSVIQKSRLSVTEWGTEAASASSVKSGLSDLPDHSPVIDLTVDHPFIFFLVEKTSGVILLEGVFTGYDRA